MLERGESVAMLRSITSLIFLTAALCFAAEDKSHDVWLIRIEDVEVNEKYIANVHYKLNKVEKHRKSLDLNYTALKACTEDLMCQVNIFQKNGGKYVKAPVHVPKTACCTLIKNNGFVWRCLRDSSNLPESCPLPRGDYLIKDFDPDLCEYPKNLPPNGAEDYKVEFIGSFGAEQVFKYVGFGKIKKRMQLV